MRGNQETESNKRRGKWKGCVCVSVCARVEWQEESWQPSRVWLGEWSFSSRPCAIRSGPAGPAVMNRQNSPAQHKGSGLIIGRLMLSDTHTHTLSLSFSQSATHGWTNTLGFGMKK